MNTFAKTRRAVALHHVALNALTLLGVSILLIAGLYSLEMLEIQGQLQRAGAWLKEYTATPDFTLDDLAEEFLEVSVSASYPMGLVLYDKQGKAKLALGFLKSTPPGASTGANVPEGTLFHLKLPSNKPLRALRLAVLFPPGATALLAADTSRAYRYLLLLAGLLAAADLVVLALAAWLDWLLAPKAMKPLLEAYKAMQESLAITSHELRTPLAALQGEAEVALRRHRSEEDYRQSLEYCREYAVQMLGTLDNLLALSRLQAGSPLAFEAHLYLDEVVLQEVETLRSADSDHRIELDLEPDLEVTGDRDGLGRLVRNLLYNAVQHTPAQGTIRITLRRENGPEGLEAVLRISDTGEGIAPEYLPRLFEPYFRVPESKSEGSGLGLAIVKSVAEIHGGKVEVSSKLGAGTTFTVRLPL